MAQLMRPGEALLHCCILLRWKKTVGTQHWWDWFVGSFVWQQWMLMELACEPLGFPPASLLVFHLFAKKTWHCPSFLENPTKKGPPQIYVYLLVFCSDVPMASLLSPLRGYFFCGCFLLFYIYVALNHQEALSTTFHWAASLYGAYLVGAALDACLEQRQRRRWRNQRGWTKVLPFFTIDSWVELLAEALSWHKSGDLFDGLSIKDMQNTQAIH